MFAGQQPGKMTFFEPTESPSGEVQISELIEQGLEALGQKSMIKQERENLERKEANRDADLYSDTDKSEAEEEDRAVDEEIARIEKHIKNQHKFKV